jgi:hypothetical protein
MTSMTSTSHTDRPRRRRAFVIVATAAIGAVGGGALAIGTIVLAVFFGPSYAWTAGNVLWAMELIVGVALSGAIMTTGIRLAQGQL